jgi:energy-coupling factor transporter ATP-binding protein EcfA2
MRLIKARIEGFQSFSDSGDIELLEGINLVIGQNNAGKSALLRALLPDLPDDRHRTPRKWQSHELPTPKIYLTIEISGAEVRDWVLRSGTQQYFPIAQEQNCNAFMHEFFKRPNFPISVTRSAGQAFSAVYPSHQLFRATPGQGAQAVVTPRNGDLTIQRNNSNGNHDTLPNLLFAAWKRDMFYFAAERMAIGEAAPGHADRLSPNAANLPNVLHWLSGERGDPFRKLVAHLREIFPTVGNLSVRTMPGSSNNLEVRVWPTEAMERVELSFPLNASGTGVAQVIALLTAIMTIDKAIIIIDEINSFLHPAAVKALLRILQTEYAQHQYIITTHAPDVISFSNPTTIHLVKREGYESRVEKLNLADVGAFRDAAEHLGVSMADVFAAERVIWVEGQTEELCFPYLYQQAKGPLPPGTIFTSVAATGDFLANRRNRKLVFEIYTRLSTAVATLAVAVAFSFDSEKLDETEKADMQRETKGALHFLPKRHLECYLIDPAAIAAFIASKDPQSSPTVTPDAVVTALKKTTAECRFHNDDWKNDITDEQWLACVDAANLIDTVCGRLSDQRVRFKKKADSLFLLRHILANTPSHLSGLVDYVARLVAAVTPG